MSLYTAEDGRFRITIRSNGTKIDRRLPRGFSRQQAESLHDRLKAEMYATIHAPNKDSDWKEYVEKAFSTPNSWAMAAYSRAKRRDHECVLSLSDLKFICLRSAGRCEVTGVRFSDQLAPSARVRPYFQSLDRIDSSKGYSIGNCRLVCADVNIAMSVWGDEIFARLATGFVINKVCAPAILRAASR